MQQEHPENVIVTVRLERLGLEADARLPADTPMGKWLPELTMVLNRYRGTYLDPRGLAVIHDGRALEPSDTLAGLGAWDGSVLWLEERWQK
jgi:hypothetical protein